MEAQVYHVAKDGDDQNTGTKKEPFLTISKASEMAIPGSKIIVHEGIYRERITPPRGGTADNNRIVYKAAKSEKVVIKGSEVINNWVKFKGNVWKATIPNGFFGNFNPYKELIYRNHNREDKVPDDVVEEMIAKLDVPCETECYGINYDVWQI